MRMLVALIFLLLAGCMSTGPLTSRPAIQRHIGTMMSARFPLVVVENKAGERRLVEKNLRASNRVVAYIHPNHQLEVIGAKYRRWPLQLYFYLELRVMQDGREITFDVPVDRHGRPRGVPIQ